MLEPSFGAQAWWPYAAAEARATAESVALYDQSQMAVFLVEGIDASNALQSLCANNIEVAPGRVVYTQMLNNRGGVEADVTVTRLSIERYRIVTGAPNRIRDLDWIQAGLGDFSAVCIDVTESFATFALMGPRSRDLLATLTTTPLDPEHFPFATSRPIELGYTNVEAQRLSYVGELGYELFVPTEHTQHVYEQLVTTGQRVWTQTCGFVVHGQLPGREGLSALGSRAEPLDYAARGGFAFCGGFFKIVCRPRSTDESKR